ncbi:hypothetical protein MCETOYE15_00201 [Candidatus Nanopelagicaceae bacterium]|jgi:hypothetical protein
MNEAIAVKLVAVTTYLSIRVSELKRSRFFKALSDDRGDVPGWVLVVLMTTGLVTALWTIAAPRLTAILKNSLDAMNGIH